MAKKLLTIDLETGKKKLETAIVDKSYAGENKGEVAYSAEAVRGLLSDVDGSVTLPEDFKVTGVTVGNFSDGTVISQGTTVLELLQQMLQKRIAASYADPLLVLSTSSSRDVEVGEKVTPTLTAKFTKNDAGDLTKYILSKNGVEFKNLDSIQSVTEEAPIQIGDGKTLSYKATVQYADGLIKNDNFGKESPAGQIKAGSISSEVFFSGYRKVFYGSVLNPSEINSTLIRGLEKGINANTISSTFTVNGKQGTDTIIIAIPTSKKKVLKKAIYDPANLDATGSFNKSTVNVEGANGYTAVSYDVYVAKNALPYDTNITYTVTLG